MQIITFFIVYWVVMKMLLEHESVEQRIRRMDSDPSCTLKSDRWKREHPEWKGR